MSETVRAPSSRIAWAMTRRTPARELAALLEGEDLTAIYNSGQHLLGLIGAQRCVVHHRQNLVERGVMRELLEFDAGRKSIGIGVVGDQHERHAGEKHVVLQAHQPGRSAAGFARQRSPSAGSRSAPSSAS